MSSKPERKYQVSSEPWYQNHQSWSLCSCIPSPAAAYAPIWFVACQCLRVSVCNRMVGCIHLKPDSAWTVCIALAVFPSNIAASSDRLGLKLMCVPGYMSLAAPTVCNTDDDRPPGVRVHATAVHVLLPSTAVYTGSVTGMCAM